MSSGYELALSHLQNAAALPLCAPGGEQSCPVGRIRIGVFFDGTGNNMYRDEPHHGPIPHDDRDTNGPTNVVRLYRSYRGPEGTTLNKVYHHGPGTDYDSNERPILPPPGETPVSDTRY